MAPMPPFAGSAEKTKCDFPISRLTTRHPRSAAKAPAHVSNSPLAKPALAVATCLGGLGRSGYADFLRVALPRGWPDYKGRVGHPGGGREAIRARRTHHHRPSHGQLLEGGSSLSLPPPLSKKLLGARRTACVDVAGKRACKRASARASAQASAQHLACWQTGAKSR